MTRPTTSDNIERMISSNVVFPAYLLQLSEEYKVQRFINTSTFSTSTDGKTYTPQTFYAATKKATEDFAYFYNLRTNLPVITLYPYDIYGPNQLHTQFLNSLINSIRNNTPLKMSPGEQEICFLHIDDLVDAIIYSLEVEYFPKQYNIYSIYGTEMFTLKDVPHIVAEILEVPCPTIEHSVLYRDVEIMKVSPQYLLLNDWTAKINFREGIKNII